MSAPSPSTDWQTWADVPQWAIEIIQTQLVNLTDEAVFSRCLDRLEAEMPRVPHELLEHLATHQRAMDADDLDGMLSAALQLGKWLDAE